MSTGIENDDALCWNMPLCVSANSNQFQKSLLLLSHQILRIFFMLHLFLHQWIIPFPTQSSCQSTRSSTVLLRRILRHPMPEDSYNYLLSSINEINANELNNVTSILNEGPDCLALTSLFAGFSAPHVDDSFKIIDHHGLQICYKFDWTHSYQSHVPILTSFYDTCCHCAKITNVISDEIIKAAGTQGTFPN